MPTVTCKDRKNKRRFSIDWEKGFADIVVSLDHQVIGRMHSKEDFEKGQKFTLPDQSEILVKMNGKYPMGDVLIYTGDKKLKARSKLGRVFSFLGNFIDIN